MSERELPRPATPGPWHAQEPVNGFDNCWFVWATRGPNDDPSDEPIARMAHDRLNRVQAEDAAAIAALPEWIEDRDRWKARAEQAEAQVERMQPLVAACWRFCSTADDGGDMLMALGAILEAEAAA